MKSINIKNATILFSLLFLFAQFVVAQENYLFENIGVADGLSSSNFNIQSTIYQDKFGFMWFGTVDGLNRYDGYNFKIYKNSPGDTNSLPSSNILLITEDAEENLWIGTTGNMSILDRGTDKFRNFPYDFIHNNTPNNAVIESLVDNEANFWIAILGSSIQKWNKSDKKFEAIPFSLQLPGVDTLVENRTITSAGIIQLKNGNILASSFQHGVFFYNEGRNVFEKFSLGGVEHPQGIVELFEDRGGNLWITGRNLIAKYNPITRLYEIFDGWKKYSNNLQEIFIFDANEEDDGTILFNGMALGILKYVPTKNDIELMTIDGDYGRRGFGKFPMAKYVDNFGVYWVGTADHGVLKFDPKRKPFLNHPFEKESNNTAVNFTSSIIRNSQNQNELFIGTSRNGIYKFDLTKREFENLKIPINSLYGDDSNMREIVLDANNTLWFFSSNELLSSYNLDTRKTESIKLEETLNLTGQGGAINQLSYLPKNKLLVSGTSGIYIINTDTNEAERIPSLATRSYGESILKDVRQYVDKNESLAELINVGEAADLNKEFKLEEETKVLVLSLGEGIAPNGIFDYGTLYNSENKIVWAMNDLDSTFYAGGGYKNRLRIGILNLKKGNYRINASTDVGHSYANFNVPPPNDSSWYGIQVVKLNDAEFISLDEKLKTVVKENDVPNYFGTDFISTSRKYPNTIWIGAGAQGLYRYDLNSGQFKNYINTNFNSNVIDYDMIYEDAKGILWITYNPSGFYRFDPDQETFTSNSTIPDLPITAIRTLVEDYNGNIWISSSSGITKLKMLDANEWATTNFDSKDGVPGGFGRGSLISQGGEILFGSLNGITAFFPSSENNTKPIPVISNVIISDASIFDESSEIALERSIFESTELELTFDQNDVSFEFASIHFSRPSKNRVSYKMEGFNKDWIHTDRNFASFTNLEPGEYTFKVRAISGYGVQSEKDRELKITVDPPLYRTTMAYIFYGFLLVGGVFTVDRVQRRRLLTKERERQQIQEAELRAVAAEAQSRAMQAEHERQTKELEGARQLQLSMLPRELPKIQNLDIAVYMKTATEVGGDYYDFHVWPDGTLTVVIGDATGHGMKAGTVVTSTKSLFNTLADGPDIIRTFHEITRCLKLMQMEKLSMCMTMLKIKDYNVTMSTAGMPPSFVYRKNKDHIEEILIKGMPLGAFYDFPYEQKSFEINPGDTILLMSDGFPELFNQNKEMFGYGKVREVFKEVKDKSPESIIEHLKNIGTDWTNDKAPDDDVTFVVIKVK